jgi:alpha-glucosidase
MDQYKVFTLGPKFPINEMRDLVDNLHKNNQHYIVMVDPGQLRKDIVDIIILIYTAVAYQEYPSFNRGKDADVFLKTNNGSIYKGRVWPGVTAFPDWFHENTQGYWDTEFEKFFDPDHGVDIDALFVVCFRTMKSN